MLPIRLARPLLTITLVLAASALLLSVMLTPAVIATSHSVEAASAGVMSTGDRSPSLDTSPAPEPDGTLDPTFGSGGKVTTSFFSDSYNEARALVLQPDGKIVVAGYVYNDAGYSDFALARYTTSGALDLDFSSGGKVPTAFSGSVDRAVALALQPDGKIVVAGSTLSGPPRS